MGCLPAQLTVFLNLTLVNIFSVLSGCQERPFFAPEALTMERMSPRVKVAQRAGYSSAPTSLGRVYSITSLSSGTYGNFEGSLH